MQLVDLEGGQRGVPVRGERGDDAGVHVRAVGLGGHVTAQHGQGGRGHPGGGRLAVGAGDHHGAAPPAELGHEVRFDLQRDEAADHRTLTSACALRRPGCGSGCEQRRAGAEGESGHAVQDRAPVLGWPHGRTARGPSPGPVLRRGRRRVRPAPAAIRRCDGGCRRRRGRPAPRHRRGHRHPVRQLRDRGLDCARCRARRAMAERRARFRGAGRGRHLRGLGRGGPHFRPGHLRPVVPLGGRRYRDPTAGGAAQPGRPGGPAVEQAAAQPAVERRAPRRLHRLRQRRGGERRPERAESALEELGCGVHRRRAST